MSFLILGPYMIVSQMGVDLRCGYAGVPQKLLNVSERRSTAQQMRRKAVAQRVRCNLFDARMLCIPLEDEPKALSGQAFASSVEKKGGI